jgi:hypothetical protein
LYRQIRDFSKRRGAQKWACKTDEKQTEKGKLLQQNIEKIVKIREQQ